MTHVTTAVSEPFAEISTAVAAIEDGSTVGFGGYFQHRHPMAIIRELIRQGKKDLHVVAPLGGYDAELALAGGIARKITFGFISMDVFGLSPAFRRTVEGGTVEAVEYGDLALMRAFEAAERGLPYLPTRAWTGSDMGSHHPGDPVEGTDGEMLWAAPALVLDWALVHVPYATPQGDLVLLGESYDSVMVKSADRVMATAERIIPKSEVAEKWGGRTAARYIGDFIMEVPFGAHPTSCYPFYAQDAEYLLDYMDSAPPAAATTKSVAAEWLSKDEHSYQDEVGVARLSLAARRMALARRAGRLFR